MQGGKIMQPTLQVLMPMGGLGSRFTDAGYTTPKPLIEVDGVPMFIRALQSFKSVPSIKHIFVIRKEHDERYNLKNSILAQLPDSSVHILDHDTQGAVETCLIAANSIESSLPIAVADCDIYFESSAYVNKIGNSSVDGMLLTFTSDDPRYSYVKTNSDGYATETAEKIVISNNAILGGYYFKSGELFLDLANEFITSGLPENLKEYYMSHLFNILINRGGAIEVAPVDVKYIFGTPEELNNYLELSGGENH